MPHSSIIDFDADELKAGMELSVVRNNGEIWRAQVIIPKTASNTIDLPPSSGKVSLLLSLIFFKIPNSFLFAQPIRVKSNLLT